MTEQKLRWTLAEMQGRLFELSGMQGYDSAQFIKTFMNSAVAVGLDSDFDYMQWAGKEYILERMKEEYPEGFVRNGNVFDGETLFWTGYLYRCWHYCSGESSKTIYRQADADTMNASYYGLHTLDIEEAVELLRKRGHS